MTHIVSNSSHHQQYLLLDCSTLLFELVRRRGPRSLVSQKTAWGMKMKQTLTGYHTRSRLTLSVTSWTRSDWAVRGNLVSWCVGVFAPVVVVTIDDRCCTVVLGNDRRFVVWRSLRRRMVWLGSVCVARRCEPR